MAYISENYTPNKRSAAILDRAWWHKNSVPYDVTLRWLFYRVYDEGLYPGNEKGAKKKAYLSFIKLTANARHNEYKGWRPDTLVDDTSAAIEHGGGFDTPEDWAQAMTEQGRCNLHRWDGQANYVEIWFEASAMIRQFEYLTQGLKLCPLGGQPSIPFKWSLAKGLEWAAARYGLPVVVLYFGDLDAGGQQIGKTVYEHARGWCDVDFTFVRAALNPGDEVRYNLPDNPEKPGVYQWEALKHETASSIIQNAVAPYVDYDRMAEIAELEKTTTTRFRRYMQGFEVAA